MISDLLSQGVLENVLGLGERRLLVDELPLLQMRESAVKVLISSINDPPKEAQWELLPYDRQRLEEILVLRRQAVHACRQHALHRRRNM